MPASDNRVDARDLQRRGRLDVPDGVTDEHHLACPKSGLVQRGGEDVRAGLALVRILGAGGDVDGVIRVEDVTQHPKVPLPG